MSTPFWKSKINTSQYSKLNAWCSCARKLVCCLLFLFSTVSLAADPPDYFRQGLKAYDAQDYHGAYRWFLRAAKLGNSDAQYNLGVMYISGLGASPNVRRARHWFLRAAKKNHANAQYALGKLYLDKRRKSYSDLKRAREWFERAARQRHAEAMYRLGTMYTMGKGVRANHATAASWYQRAARQGDATAQLHLGRLYAKGLGVKKNLIRSYAWISVATRQSHPSAAGNLAYVRRRLNLQQRQRAEDLARRFYEQYVIRVKQKRVAH